MSFQVDQNTIHPVPLDVGAELSGLAEDEMYNNLFALHAPALTQDGIKNFLESSNPWSHKLEKSAGQRLVYRTKGEPVSRARNIFGEPRLTGSRSLLRYLRIVSFHGKVDLTLITQEWPTRSP